MGRRLAWEAATGWTLVAPRGDRRPDDAGHDRHALDAASLAASVEGSEPGRDRRPALGGGARPHGGHRSDHGRPAADRRVDRRQRQSGTPRRRNRPHPGPLGRRQETPWSFLRRRGRGADELTSMGGPLRQRIPIWVVAGGPGRSRRTERSDARGGCRSTRELGTTSSPSTPRRSGSGWTGMVAPESMSWRRAKRQPMIGGCPVLARRLGPSGRYLVARDALGDAHGAAERTRQVRERLAAGPPRLGSVCADPLSGGPEASYIRLTDWWDSTGSSLPCWTLCRP